MVFTDNGSKDLNLKDEILRLKKEKDLEIFIVLTPEYEGRPTDPSLQVYRDISQVFNIADVGLWVGAAVLIPVIVGLVRLLRTEGSRPVPSAEVLGGFSTP